MALFVLAAAATGTISGRDPFLAWGYCLGIFLFCMYWALRDFLMKRANSIALGVTIPVAALALISLWGFGQLAAGATVYRHGTWNASVRTAALGGTAFLAARALAGSGMRFRFLRAFAWFGFAVSMVSFAAYFTSPGRVLWIFPSPYPDVWGPFLSRNDLAGFLELCLPVALWLALEDGRRGWPASMPLWAPAWMLACGLASGSRAGAAVLLAETGVVLILLHQRRAAASLGGLAAIFVAITGAGALPGRLSDPDPLRYRREIATSTLQMIAERPWRGFGVGTYAQVYPAYAQFDSGAVVEHAHNDWLEWAAEGGIPLAVAWAALAGGTCGPAFRSVWGLGIIAAFAHAFVDYPFARFGLTAWNFALIGALSAAPLRKVTRRLHSSMSAQKESCS